MRIVGGKYRGKKLISPDTPGTRPTSDRTRETIFNILLHNPMLGPNALINKAILDVFAGTGALGLEAFSRGASSVTFIENNKAALITLHMNVKAFGLLPSSVLEQDVRDLGYVSKPFDLVFLDPPYQKGLISSALDQLLSHGWLSKKAVIVMEIAKNESFVVPSYLTPITERTVGPAKIIFSRLVENISINHY
ncbi:MAG: 16S rRNA (guanine(966)-N(2))-methyltransferase RsmD [Alphaproteobacteria bacterium]|nr:16S rRNA (guanine(966)-N(2))-methyltransferase RsmD [Alphaproteobacteria bacterium]